MHGAILESVDVPDFSAHVLRLPAVVADEVAMVADVRYSLVVITSRPGTIHARVQECVDGFSGRPFRVAEIAEILGLTTAQTWVAVWTLLRAGVISCVGEDRKARRSGRKEKLYAASETRSPTSDAEKIRGAVQRFSDRYEFSSTDISRDLKIRAETIVTS